MTLKKSHRAAQKLGSSEDRNVQGVDFTRLERMAQLWWVSGSAISAIQQVKVIAKTYTRSRGSKKVRYAVI